jgi:hypothetical protein
MTDSLLPSAAARMGEAFVAARDIFNRPPQTTGRWS